MAKVASLPPSLPSSGSGRRRGKAGGVGGGAAKPRSSSGCRVADRAGRGRADSRTAVPLTDSASTFRRMWLAAQRHAAVQGPVLLFVRAHATSAAEHVAQAGAEAQHVAAAVTGVVVHRIDGEHVAATVCEENKLARVCERL